MAAPLVLLAAGCAGFGYNYEAEQGPRYAEAIAPRLQKSGDTLLIVSFNIRYAAELDSALAVLTQDEAARDADIVLLQEMDAPGTQRMARALGLSYVYYPATYRHQTGKDFGNAVLSRWPIVADAKLILPHLAYLGRTRRTATAATIRVKGVDVRVYSVHLATIVNSSEARRRDQLLEVLNDAALFDRVVVGGDLNDPELGIWAEQMGYAWPTRHGPPTAAVARLDHILLRGLRLPAERPAGTVLNNRNSSDHRPVWVRAILR